MGRVLGSLYNHRDSFVRRPSTAIAESTRLDGLDYGLSLARDVRRSPQRLANMRTTSARFPQKKPEKRCAGGGDYLTKRSASGDWITFREQARARSREDARAGRFETASLRAARAIHTHRVRIMTHAPPAPLPPAARRRALDRPPQFSPSRGSRRCSMRASPTTTCAAWSRATTASIATSGTRSTRRARRRAEAAARAAARARALSLSLFLSRRARRRARTPGVYIYYGRER